MQAVAHSRKSIRKPVMIGLAALLGMSLAAGGGTASGIAYANKIANDRAAEQSAKDAALKAEGDAELSAFAERFKDRGATATGLTRFEKVYAVGFTEAGVSKAALHVGDAWLEVEQRAAE